MITGEYLGMSYMELIPVLIKGMQEPIERLTTQEDEIRALRTENQKLR